MSGRGLRWGGILLAAAAGAICLSRGRRHPAARIRPAPPAPLHPALARPAPRQAPRFHANMAANAPLSDAAIEPWSDADPAGLAAYAYGLPRGPSRSLALASALPKWVARDAASASDWLAGLPPEPDLDPGAVALAMLPELPERRPRVSIEWAAGISDDAARDATLQNIAERWTRAAPGALSAFLSAETGLRDEDRRSLALGARIAAVPPGQRGL